MDEKPTYRELEKRILQLESAHNRTTETLQESRALLQLLYKRAPLAYQSLDEYGNFIEVSPSWIEVLGYSREEVIGKSFSEFLHPDLKDHFKKNFSCFKAVDEILGVEFEMIKKNGSLISVSLHGKTGKDKYENFQQTLCIFHDNTESKRAKDMLRESEKRYKSLFKYNYSVMLIIDPENADIVDANSAAISYYGWSHEEIIRKKIRVR